MRASIKSFLKFILAALGVIVAAILAFLFVGWPRLTPHVDYGVTFSKPYAEALGEDPDRALTIALDDIGIRNFRIPAYWNTLEPQPGIWNFTDLDKQIDTIGARGGHVTLAVGQKLPRWPECWEPIWVKKLPINEQHTQTLRYIEQVVARYRNNPTIIAWQVENEPHFFYGECSKPDYAFIHSEVAFVRGLDGARPLYTTDSGELSSWTSFGSTVDRLGVSVYRIVRNPLLGNYNVSYWFLPPYFYARKAALASLFGLQGIYVSEFQMEPWSNKPLEQTPIADQLTSMNERLMKNNFAYAERMNLNRVDFWGVEWWIWMADHGHPELLQTAKNFWGSHPTTP